MSPASFSLDAGADAVATLLGLVPHPEGGEYVETWRDRPPDGSRGAGTAIYFLLRDGPPSRWHRLDAAEVWHFYAGAPLELRVSGPAGPLRTHVLGIDFAAGERPQAVVPAGGWQSARTLGPWTLVGCTVAPAFSFDGFELAAPTDGDSPPIQEG